MDKGIKDCLHFYGFKRIDPLCPTPVWFEPMARCDSVTGDIDYFWMGNNEKGESSYLMRGSILYREEVISYLLRKIIK